MNYLVSPYPDPIHPAQQSKAVTPITAAPSASPRSDNVTRPSSLNSERDVLSAVLLDDSVMPEITALITPDMFHRNAHRRIFGAMLGLWIAQKSIDLTTLENQLVAQGFLEEAGGRKYLAELFVSNYSTLGVVDKAKVILDCYKRRSLIDMAKELAIAASNMSVPYAEARALVEPAVEKIDRLTISDGLQTLAELTAQFKLDAQARASGGQSVLSYPSGLYDLDKALNGFQNKLYLFMGRPGMGKSVTSMVIAEGMAQYSQKNNLGKWVHYHSLEMPREENINRLTSDYCKIPYKDLEVGAIPQGKYADYLAAIDQTGQLPIAFNDYLEAPPTLQEVCASSIQRQHTQPPMCIIVDHIGWLIQNEMNAKEELGKICKAFKALQKRLGCPVILLHQLNRGVEGRKDKHPMLSDGRDSGHIEQDLDVIVGLYRDEYYEPNTTKQGIIEMGILKQRGGANVSTVGWLDFLFDAPMGRIRNLASSTPHRLRSVPQPQFTP